MEISERTIAELMLRAAELKEDESAQHVLMAVRRAIEVYDSRITIVDVLGAVADGLGVSLG